MRILMKSFSIDCMKGESGAPLEEDVHLQTRDVGRAAILNTRLEG